MTEIAQAETRRRALMDAAIGQQIRDMLDDETLTDILLNPDGRVWTDSITSGRSFSGVTMTPAHAETVLRLVASHKRMPITMRTPIIDNAALPGGQRFSGTTRPVTENPSFAVRLPHSGEVDISKFRGGSINVPRVTDVSFINAGNELEHLMEQAARRKNIVIAGATGSGKTTLFNCLLKTMDQDRLCVVEDAKELVIPDGDNVRFLSLKGIVSMDDLLVLSLRYRPDRILVGEIRTPNAAKMFVQATNTGHKGSCATIHASSAAGVMPKLEDMCSAGDSPIPPRSLKEAVDLVVFVEKMEDNSRRITEVIGVNDKPIRVRAVQEAKAPAKRKKKPSSRVITFTEAREQGIEHYFTGEPCVRGHIAKRAVSGKKCVQCVSEDAKLERQQRAAAKREAAAAKLAARSAEME